MKNEIILLCITFAVRLVELAADRRKRRRDYRRAKSPYDNYSMEDFEKDHHLKEEERRLP